MAIACRRILVVECESCGDVAEYVSPRMADPVIARRLAACRACDAVRVESGGEVVAGPLSYWWSGCG